MTVLTVLRLTVELEGPWLVGDPAGFGDVDTMPLREPDGAPQIPATSVAGSIRSHLSRQSDIDVSAWMGEARRSDDDRSGRPSRLRVLGLRLTGGDATTTRTSTAVDAVTGSALLKALRREEYVDAKTRLAVYLLHDHEPEQALLHALTSWQPVIGRRRTNGWGQAAVTEVKHTTVDLRERSQLVHWLSGGGPEHVDELLANAAALPIAGNGRNPDLLRVRFAVPVGVHVGSGELSRDDSGAAAGGSNRMATAEILRRNGVPYVPASSWRGVLRGHAAFVLRSLGCPADTTRQAVEEVFGGLQRRGMLTFHDATLQAPDGEDPQETPASREKSYQHVGIDRITGGARPNLLFADRAAIGTVQLRVSADDPEAVPGWARKALGHAVRDLNDGFLAIGGRSTRGLGALELVDEPSAVVPAAAGIGLDEVTPRDPEEDG